MQRTRRLVTGLTLGISLAPTASATGSLTPEGWTFLSLAVVLGIGATVLLFLKNIHLRDLMESSAASVALMSVTGVAYIVSLIVPWSGSYGTGAFLWGFTRVPPPGQTDTLFLYVEDPTHASIYLMWLALPMWIAAAFFAVAAGFSLLGSHAERAVLWGRLSTIMSWPAMVLFILGVDLADGANLAFGAGLVVGLLCIAGSALLGLAGRERPPRRAPDEEPAPAFKEMPEA